MVGMAVRAFFVQAGGKLLTTSSGNELCRENITTTVWNWHGGIKNKVCGAVLRGEIYSNYVQGIEEPLIK